MNISEFLRNEIADIPEYKIFKEIKLLTKGMSSDKKYYIETVNNKRLLLRIADISRYEQKKQEFDLMGKAVALGIPMQQPISFGGFNESNNVYTLLTWVDGEEVESVLPKLSKNERYNLGIRSGEILRQIHNLPAPEGIDDWSDRYFKVIDERLDAFHTEGVSFEGSKEILTFLDNNRNLLKGRPQCRHHGDYHEGNMVVSESGELSIIDWHTVDFGNYGDPWYDFTRIGTKFPEFASGQIDGYFDKEPPEQFWILFAYYLSVSAITSIVWAKFHVPKELKNILKMNRDVLHWFDNMRNPVPKWYR